MTRVNSIYSILFRHAKEDAKNAFLYYKDEIFSYEEVLNNTIKIAATLNKAGIRKGTRVALMLPNSPDYVFAFLALSRLEAIIIPVNIKYKSLALRHILSDSKAKGIIYHSDYESQVTSAVEILDYCDILISSDENSSITEFDLLINDSSATFGGPFNPLGDDLAIIFYSAGTTGPSRGALYSNTMLLQNSDAVSEIIHLKEKECTFLQFPLYHFYSIVSGLLSTLLRGSSLYLFDDHYKEFPKIFSKIRMCKTILASPSFFEKMINDETIESLPESMRFGLTGGTRLEKDLPEKFIERFSRPLFLGYGMVEAGPVLSINFYQQKPTSIGASLSDFSMNLETNKELVSGSEIGEILIPESILSRKFTGRNGLDKQRVINGCYLTGDLAHRDMDGFFYFIDRDINRINVNGFDVFPEFVENAIIKHLDVEDVTVIGVPGRDGTETIQANIVVKNPHRTREKEIFDFLKNKIPKYQIPHEIVFLKHLPKNITGKVSRQTLRNNALNRTLPKVEEKNERV